MDGSLPAYCWFSCLICGPGVECDEGGVSPAPLLCKGAANGLTLGAGGASGRAVRRARRRGQGLLRAGAGLAHQPRGLLAEADGVAAAAMVRHPA